MPENFPITEVVLAYPSIRRNSTVNIVNEIALHPGWRVTIICRNKHDANFFGNNCPASVKLIEYVGQEIENLQEDANNPEYKRRRISELLRSGLRKLIYEYGLPKLTFGLFDYLLEQITTQKLLYRSMSLELLLKSNLGISSNTNVLIFVEGDRGMDLELPLMLAKKRNENWKYIVTEIADSATEIDLSKFPRERSRFYLFNSYKRKGQKRFKQTSFQDVFYYSHSTANALKKLGIDSPFPWRIGLCGEVDLVFVRNEKTIDSLIKLGHPVKKFQVTGDLNFDSIYRKKMSSLPRGDDEELQNKTLILALPNWLESSREFSSKNLRKIRPELCQIVDSFSLIFQKVIIVLHPKQKKVDYGFLPKRMNVVILEDNLYEVLNSGDFFCSTYSSTLTYGHVLGLPTIVLLPKFWKHSKDCSELLKNEDWNLVVSKASEISIGSLTEFFGRAVPYFNSGVYLNSSEKLLFDGKSILRLLQGCLSMQSTSVMPDVQSSRESLG
jgi:hypothetical protein